MLGAILGGIIGGIIGFFIPGLGVLYGAAIGFSFGLIIDPITPDVKGAGTPIPGELDIMPSDIGVPLPDLVGTAKILGHLLCFGKERAVAQTVEVEGGCFQSDETYITGYKYYMSWAVGIVAGPVDILYTIYNNEDVVWEGELELPVSGGQETIVIEGMGSAIFYFGTADQVANSDVGELIGDETLNSPYRHLCWCFFDDCYIGELNRCPTMKFILGKYPVIAFSADNVIQTYDYNPMHAIWYIFHDLAGLPEAWLHTADFLSAATVLADETRGICCLFIQQQSALNYLENINNHIDGIIRYGSDGKFHPKLIREDYVVDDLLLIDEGKMLEDPTLNRKSWIDTVNEMKVQYTELLVPFPQGRWVAAQSQPDTSYIYLYDILKKAVIKLKTSIPPVVTGVLHLESLYGLNYDRGEGNPGTQRGGYCMNKDGTRLWYLFRSASGDCQLIEVDISQATMRIVKKTTFAGLLVGQHVEDGCSDNTYTYWCTERLEGRIIKIRNSDHSIIDDHNFSFDLSGCATNHEGISTIDVDIDTGKLYWNYVLDHMGCSPQYNACAHYIISDSDFNIDVDAVECNSGFQTPQWQNIVRIYSGYVLQHRAYYTSSGPLQKKSLSDYAILNSKNQEFLQNIFGVKNNYLFTLRHASGVNHPAHLYCLNFSDLSEVSAKNVSYYAGQKYGDYDDWDWTSVSAMSEQTGVIIIVRYNHVEEKNYVASFEADSTLKLLDDSTPVVYSR